MSKKFTKGVKEFEAKTCSTTKTFGIIDSA